MLSHLCKSEGGGQKSLGSKEYNQKEIMNDIIIRELLLSFNLFDKTVKAATPSSDKEKSYAGLNALAKTLETIFPTADRTRNPM